MIIAPIKMCLKIAFIMDPFERLDAIHEDTSCCLITECLRRGHRVFYLQIKDLQLWQGEVLATLRRVIKRGKKRFLMDKPELINLNDLQVIFIRKDPPFDQDYLYSTYILEHVSPSTLLVNDPGGIRQANEKLYVLNFPSFAPRSLVSKKLEDLKRFLLQVGGKMVVKPLNECSGRGVIYLREGDVNLNSLLEMSTQGGRRFVIAQEYLPQVRGEGDKRILLLEGKPIGAMCRIPPGDDYRANIHRGARFAQAQISSQDEKICSNLAPRLVSDGIYFAGIDIIGGKIVEINVTSPAGVPEINRLDQEHLEKYIIDWMEKKAG